MTFAGLGMLGFSAFGVVAAELVAFNHLRFSNLGFRV